MKYTYIHSPIDIDKLICVETRDIVPVINYPSLIEIVNIPNIVKIREEEAIEIYEKIKERLELL